jgi:probable phosphoglycerate mutase
VPSLRRIPQTVVASHSDPLKVALAHYTGLHLDLFQRLVIDPAGERIGLTHMGRLIRCNDTAHPVDPSTVPAEQWAGFITVCVSRLARQA